TNETVFMTIEQDDTPSRTLISVGIMNLRTDDGQVWSGESLSSLDGCAKTVFTAIST
ncbi:13772_t:CDS:2, partial [Cetraspora pellucida]